MNAYQPTWVYLPTYLGPPSGPGLVPSFEQPRRGYALATGGAAFSPVGPCLVSGFQASGECIPQHCALPPVGPSSVPGFQAPSERIPSYLVPPQEMCVSNEAAMMVRTAMGT